MGGDWPLAGEFVLMGILEEKVGERVSAGETVIVGGDDGVTGGVTFPAGDRVGGEVIKDPDFFFPKGGICTELDIVFLLALPSSALFSSALSTEDLSVLSDSFFSWGGGKLFVGAEGKPVGLAGLEDSLTALKDREWMFVTGVREGG
jgi:hypothetical protein